VAAKLAAMQRPQRIAPGVELFPALTPTLPPATHTNSYALGEREVLLVEPATPYAEEQQAFITWAEAIRAEGRQLQAILLTHHHPDHAAGAADLSRALGLPLWVHVETARRLPELVCDRLLEDGERIRLAGPEEQCWQILHTPGHAPGHVCLHELGTRSVVVGDMIASVGTILIEPTDGDMRIYLEQLARLEALGAGLALPAHGDPIPEPSRLFRFYIGHRLLRERKVLAALRESGAHGASVETIVRLAYADTPQAAWPLAQLSVQAHLVKLLVDGLVLGSGERYRAA
jgi:endoribonuclease LACTB2